MAVPSAPPVETRAERLRNFWSDFRESWVAVGALTVIALLLFLSFGAPLVSPQDPYDMAALDWLDAFLRPGTEGSGGYVHLLGTDNAGRDMLSAIFYGLRTSFVIGLSAGALALLVGIAVGLTAAYFGGRIEALLMRIVDLQLSMPAILLALVLVAMLGQGIGQIILALVVAQYAYFARTTHGAAKVERGKDYIEAARSTPLPTRRVLFRHLLPNVLPPLIVVATVQVASAIALEATLSFLGVGLPLTEPSLGSLISNGFKYIHSDRYWLSIYPGLALMVTVVAINLVGDQVRKVLDPRNSR
ncbi:ABC transporter permease [Sulfitobacter sp. KE34]|uniref:ABC transporter permease n=2 Tax=Roseobacteraceae TaxID=2854170 RepID=A0AAX3LUF7_9RHOB|nr:ABC transporter permease [Sulfitobacter faviae]MDF3351247.1 ABC transporter permease [Sulfitobacter sp. KE12]MDF3354919.1 ABC transporter permease [Sulfitobacter sp. KE27]MDF3358567.1 ABC transporter permease [Sulfitobacter sp. KE33]MDF3362382.1 ABC transporter permease [Sulfitobacter sp. Ks41]MDF3365991.1 ABC transporter permease [Sulfitobacter sp. Ks34]MDF3369600.1 ABC transporter permease [Sulfitobacter sp. Ks43]MDF3373249.1 ABC transporter permease [Sulfitobacter sp. KS8]MDF3376886.1